MQMYGDYNIYDPDETKGWNYICALELTLIKFSIVNIDNEWDYSEVAEFDEKYSPKD